jgi:protein dithiol oxidoreductase (disulfide-forming)
MDRLLQTAIVIAALGATGACLADIGGWRDGVHYRTLSNPPPIHTTDRIRVVEVFSYSCAGCYKFERYVAQWREQLPERIEFSRVPSSWNAQGRAHARLFYTLQTLRRNDLDEEIFATVHEKKNPLYGKTEQETYALQAEFARAHGIGEREFFAAYHSQAVEQLTRKAQETLLRYGVEHTPALVVNDRYLTDASYLVFDKPTAETVFRRLLEVTTLLAESEWNRKEPL